MNATRLIRRLVIGCTVFIGALLPQNSLLAESDSKKERLAAAKKHLEVIEFRAQMLTPTQYSKRKLPEGLPEEHLRAIQDYNQRLEENDAKARGAMDLNRLEKAAIEALAQTFTTEELNGINEFFSSPEGKAFRTNIETYLSEVNLLVVEERQKARKAAQSQSSEAMTHPPSAAVQNPPGEPTGADSIAIQQPVKNSLTE